MMTKVGDTWFTCGGGCSVHPCAGDKKRALEREISTRGFIRGLGARARLFMLEARHTRLERVPRRAP